MYLKWQKRPRAALTAGAPVNQPEWRSVNMSKVAASSVDPTNLPAARVPKALPSESEAIADLTAGEKGAR